MYPPLKIVFAGTPDFAATALADLLASRHQVVAVYTQPDRPAGRGRRLTPSPVKRLALEHGLPVHQPTTLKGAEEQALLADLAPDVMVVAAYGLLLPPEVLAIPRHGCLNIHASLLPRWRGAAPIQRAILAGDAESGVTIMQMDEGLDTGDMLYRVATPIGPEDTAECLHDRLARLGGEALLATLEALQAGTVVPEPQDPAQATYAGKLHKEEARIDWSRSAAELDRQVRAFNPWPVAQTRWEEVVLRIWAARPLPADGGGAEPGRVVGSGRTGIDVACGDGVLRLTRIQLPGKKPMEAAAFLNAHDLSGALLE